MITTRRDAGLAMAAVASSPLLMGFGAVPRTAPVVATSNGAVRGFHDRGVLAFHGVRYGADTRARRFMKPAAPTPWQNIHDATQFAAAAPQGGDTGPGDEDCLFLNVWTPRCDEAARPVVVYIHGGGYATGAGSDPQTNGARLARFGDVVVVTVNHRLNAFGYLSLANALPGYAPDSGNVGQWDLVLALEWVRDNARRFGGDPARVLLLGQSGGGAKIATLMATQAARGLFHAAMTMSGQQVTASGPLNAARRARAFVAALGVDTNAGDEAFASLRAMPAQRIVEALRTPDAIDASRGAMYFGPVLDGRMLTRHPFWPDSPPLSADIPMILGNTRDETRSLIGRSEPDCFSLSWADLPERLARHMRCDIDPAFVISAYRSAYPTIAPPDLFFAATTASRSWRGQVEQADARARQGARTWVYRYDLPSPRDGGRWGAPHTIDIAAVFGNVEAPGAYIGRDRESRRVSEAMMATVATFARTGDPNNPSAPEWPLYTLPSRRTMIFDAALHVDDDPRGEERELFAAVPFIQWGT